MSRTRTALMFAVFGVLLVVLATTIFSSSTPHDALDESAPPSLADDESIATNEAPTAPRIDSTSSTPLANESAIDRESVASTADTGEPESTDGRVIEGTVVVVDDRGVEHAATSGSLEAIPIDESRSIGPALEVQVLLGRFSFRAPSDTRRLHFVRSTLDLRSVYCEEDSVAITDTPLALRFHYRGRTIVRVRDEVTGVDLTDVTLRTDAGAGTISRYEHPGLPPPASSLADHANSPIDITSRMGDATRLTIYAKAPGYAWGHADVNPRKGGELPILLRPGGRLVVRTSGASPPDDAFVRVRRDHESRPRAEAALSTSAEYDFDGMLPGEYRVTVETTHWWNDPKPLATAEVALAAGATETVVLEIPPQPVIADVPFSGIVFLPREWERREFSLSLEPIDHSSGRFLVNGSMIEPLPHDPESFRFDAGLIAPGRYEVQVSPFQWVLVHDVGPTGDVACRIEIPPPTHVSVRVLDALTGGPAKIENISWFVQRPEEVNGGSLESVGRDPKSGLFEFDCVTAPIEVHIWEDGYSFLNETHVLVPGANEITIHLSPSCGIDFLLRCDGRPILFPRGFDFDLTSVSGDGQTVASSFGDERQRRVVDVPGRYRVAIPAIQGYLPVEPFEVDIAAGTFVEHVIELTLQP